MAKQKQSELALKLDMMIGQLQQAVRATRSGNYLAASAYLKCVKNQLPQIEQQINCN